jgi:uncharacterized protein (TIGR02594 family)
MFAEFFKSLLNSLTNLFKKDPQDGSNKPPAVIPPKVIEDQLIILTLKDYAWGREALKHRGQKEIPGNKDNPEIMSWYWEVMGNKKVQHDETANCMAFAMCMFKRAGMKYIKSLWAADARKVGQLCKLKLGCLVGKRSTAAASGIHVTFCEAIDEKNGVFYGFGANQQNQAMTSKYKISDVVFCVWPDKA